MGGTLAPTLLPGGIAGTGVTVFEQDAPPPPPATWDAYQKKGEESGGVIAMMKLLIKDLTKQSQEMEFEEKDAQEDYEKFIADSAEKRSADSKSIGEKEAATTMEYIKSLHQECDWLAKNFELRKQARADE